MVWKIIKASMLWGFFIFFIVGNDEGNVQWQTKISWILEKWCPVVTSSLANAHMWAYQRMNQGKKLGIFYLSVHFSCLHGEMGVSHKKTKNASLEVSMWDFALNFTFSNMATTCWCRVSAHFQIHQTTNISLSKT